MGYPCVTNLWYTWVSCVSPCSPLLAFNTCSALRAKLMMRTLDIQHPLADSGDVTSMMSEIWSLQAVFKASKYVLRCVILRCNISRCGKVLSQGENRTLLDMPPAHSLHLLPPLVHLLWLVDAWSFMVASRWFYNFVMHHANSWGWMQKQQSSPSFKWWRDKAWTEPLLWCSRLLTCPSLDHNDNNLLNS